MPSSSTSPTLTMEQVSSAQLNLSMVDAALGEIRRLLLQKEALQKDVEDLKREKALLTGEVTVLRGDTNPSEVKRSSSSPDLCSSQTDDSSSTYDSDDEDSDEVPSGMTKSERLSNAPERFICPLTLQVMKHPMRQKGTKKNYERGAILEWIYFGKATCPLTRKKLHPGDFEENVLLQREIEHWRRLNGLGDESEQDQMDDSDVIPTLSPEEEVVQQKRLVRQLSKGSDNNLMGLRDRILRNRDDRVRRRMSGGNLL